jgi:hypothetical protein
MAAATLTEILRGAFGWSEWMGYTEPMASVLARILDDVETLEPEERDILRAKLEQFDVREPFDADTLDELKRRVASVGEGALLHEHTDVRHEFLASLKR